MVKLKRLMPGCSVGINAMADEAGNISTDPKEVAALLKDHWEKVFKKRGIDEARLGDWLREEFGDVSSVGLPGVEKWRVNRNHVKRALKISGNSSPGFDKIPYKIWRALGDLAVDTLFDAAAELQFDNSTTLLSMSYADSKGGGRHDFNLGLLCCLPKKKSGHT